MPCLSFRGRRLCQVLVLFGGAAVGWGAAEWDFEPPVLHLPHLATAPVIDGRIEVAEWAGAARLTGFMTHKEKAMLPAELQPVWHLAWDEENLYIAQRYPLYPKGTLIAATKEGDQGGANAEAMAAMVREDHCEILLATVPDRNTVWDEFFYQLVINPYGALGDARPRMSEGWLGQEWESGARVASQIDQDYWHLEVALPLISLGYALPVADGTRLYGQLVSSSDPEQFWAAWAPQSWKGWRLFPEIILDRRAPAVRVEELGPYEEGRLDAKLRIVNATAAAYGARLTAALRDRHGQIVFTTDQAVEVAAGGTLELPLAAPDLRLDTPTDLSWDGNTLRGEALNILSVSLADATGATLYRQAWRFTPRPADLEEVWLKPYAARRSAVSEPVLHSAYYPYYDRLKVTVDLDILGLDARYRVAKRLEVAVEQMLMGSVQNRAAAAGLRFAEGSFELPETMPLVVELPVRPLAPGQYLVRLRLVDEAGKELFRRHEPFRREFFAWERNALGSDLEAIPPFKPMTATATALTLWGRRYDFAPTGLPAAMVSQGVDVLAGTPELTAVVDGVPVRLDGQEFSWTQRHSGQMIGVGRGKLGPLEVTITGVTEYDGCLMLMVDYASPVPVLVQSMQLAIPLPAAVATTYLVHEPTGQAGATGAVPAADGVFWRSTQMTGAAHLRGKFLPSLYLGDGERGLCYVAASDEGWVLDDGQASSHLERTDAQVRLVLHLANTERRLERPRRLTFALQATPVRPLPPDYRTQMGAYGAREETPFDTGFLTGYGAASNTSSGTGPGTDALTMRSDLEYEILRDQILAYRRGAWPNYQNVLVHRYATTNCIGQGMPEFACFGGEWSGRTLPLPKPTPGLKTVESSFGRFDDHQATRQWVDLCQSQIDMRVWAFDQHQRRCGLNGYHWDHTQFWSSGDLLKGTAYRRDDGSLQGSNNIFLFRQLFKRMAVVSYRNAMRSWHGRYSPPVMPVEAFADRLTLIEWIWYCKGQDQFERFGSLAKYRALCGRWTGLPAYHFPSVQDKASEHPNQTRSVFGLGLLHDVGVVRPHAMHVGTLAGVRRGLDAVGYFDSATEWVPYWRSGELVQVDGQGQEVVATVYLNRQAADGPKALLVLFNAGEQDCEAQISPQVAALLGVDRASTITDGESGAEFATVDGTLVLLVNRHDFRLVEVR